MKKIRIGGGQGFWGDSHDAAIHMMKTGKLNYMACDYLAELTLSIMARQKMKDPKRGYATDFIDLFQSVAEDSYYSDIGILTNAGGMNIEGAVDACSKVAQNKKMKGYKIGYVLGDDIKDKIPQLIQEGYEFKNLDDDLTKTFETEENELIDYINKYYNELKKKKEYTSDNDVNTLIKAQVNSTVLSVFYEINFKLQNIDRSYIITLNIDLKTNKVLTIEDLLLKYNYNKEYISEKIFNDDVLIDTDVIVIDKNTNISLTKSDIEKKKNEYVQRITNDFNNIIKVYIENNTLVLVYNKKDLNDLFFENDHSNNNELKIKYLK